MHYNNGAAGEQGPGPQPRAQPPRGMYLEIVYMYRRKERTMFKKILRKILAAKKSWVDDKKHMDEFNEICGEIDRAFCQGKINWEEHEMLYEIA